MKKKIYIIPKMDVVRLGGKAVCQSLIVGSGQTDDSTGNGVDLVKEDRGWDIWGDDDNE